MRVDAPKCGIQIEQELGEVNISQFAQIGVWVMNAVQHFQAAHHWETDIERTCIPFLTEGLTSQKTNPPNRSVDRQRDRS